MQLVAIKNVARKRDNTDNAMTCSSSSSSSRCLTSLCGRCDRHDSPLGIFFCPTVFCCPIALMSRLTQSVHLCFGLPPLPGGTISRAFLPTYSRSRLFTCPYHLSLAFLHLSAMFSFRRAIDRSHGLFKHDACLSLMLSFLTQSPSVLPHAQLHIFNYVTYNFFTWELVTGTGSIPNSMLHCQNVLVHYGNQNRSELLD